MKNVKSIIFHLYFIIQSTVGFSQDLEIGNNYFFKADLHGLASDKLKMYGNATLPSGIEIKKTHQVKIINIENGKIYFEYLPFLDTKNANIYNKDSDGKTNVFYLNEDDFKKFTSTYYNRFRGFKYGAYTVPIRLRSYNNNFEFNSNLSLGANIIGRFGSRMQENSFVDVSLGVGLTKVDLNSDNSLLGTTDSDFEDIDVLSPTAFTLTLGALINLAKNVNIGLYVGWDKISSSDNKAQWIYNGKPWLGIGLNVSFSGDANQSDAKK